MLSAELPHNEVQRQQALERQDLLDSPADPYLDTLTRIARELFAVKTVLISLIDNDRQWFMSRQGLELAETPRCISFCAHAILQDDAPGDRGHPPGPSLRRQPGGAAITLYPLLRRPAAA